MLGMVCVLGLPGGFIELLYYRIFGNLGPSLVLYAPLGLFRSHLCRIYHPYVKMVINNYQEFTLGLSTTFGYNVAYSQKQPGGLGNSHIGSLLKRLSSLVGLLFRFSRAVNRHIAVLFG